MRHCWICRREIPDDEATKDHVMPKEPWDKRPRGPWFWAHFLCNNARSNITLTVVEDIQNILDRISPNWDAHIIRAVLIIRRGKKYKGGTNEEIVEGVVYNIESGVPPEQGFGVRLIQQRPRKSKKRTIEYNPWVPEQLSNGATVWVPKKVTT